LLPHPHLACDTGLPGAWTALGVPCIGLSLSHFPVPVQAQLGLFSLVGQ
jgi:hypothetical protein